MTPLVSVLVAAYQAANDIGPCLQSVLGQSLTDFELVVVDDGSTDRTVETVRRMAGGDRRVRLLRLPENRGASVARNTGMAVCRGRWVAFLDSDDSFAPNRLAVLVARAEASGAEMVADNLQIVSHPGRRPLGVAFAAAGWPAAITVAAYIRNNDFRAARYAYGYLKPMLRRDFVETRQIRFREDLALCEDYHFHLDCLLAGASWSLVPDALYRYAVRSASLSRAMSPQRLDAVLTHSRRQLDELGPSHPLWRLMARRHRRLARLQAYLSVRQDWRGGAWASALQHALRRPEVLAPGLAALWRRGLARLPGASGGIPQR